MRVGEVYHLSGDSKDLWIENYNCRVNTPCRVEAEPKANAKKVLVTLASIDGDVNVTTLVRKSKLIKR